MMTMYDRTHGLPSNVSFTFDFGRHLHSHFDCRSIALNDQENCLLLVGNHELKFIHFDTLISSMVNPIGGDEPSLIIPCASDLQSVPLFDLYNINRPVVQWNHHDANQYAVAVDRLVRFYTVDQSQLQETTTTIDTQHQVRKSKKRTVRWPGVEPGSAAWKATMLTVTPPTLRESNWCFPMTLCYLRELRDHDNRALPDSLFFLASDLDYFLLAIRSSCSTHRFSRWSSATLGHSTVLIKGTGKFEINHFNTVQHSSHSMAIDSLDERQFQSTGHSMRSMRPTLRYATTRFLHLIDWTRATRVEYRLDETTAVGRVPFDR